MEYSEYSAKAVAIEKWKGLFNSAILPEEYDLLLIRPISMHPDDYYLAIVLCHLPNNNLHPYATWICNASFERPFYNSGCYFKNIHDAFENWKARV